MESVKKNPGLVRLATFNVEKMNDGVLNPYKSKPYNEVRKTDEGMLAVANILSDSGADIVSLQEVENVEMLRSLRERADLKKMFPYCVLVEGNDERKGFDVALMSRYPIQGYTTHKDQIIGEDKGKDQYFSRDLLQVEIELPQEKTLRVFCNHFVYQGRENDKKSIVWCREKRQREAEATAQIVSRVSEEVPTDFTAILGDFNDFEDSQTLDIIEEGADLVNSSEGMPPSWGISKPHKTLSPSRLDHILVDELLAKRLQKRGVLVHPDEAKASDHRLVWADYKLAS